MASPNFGGKQIQNEAKLNGLVPFIPAERSSSRKRAPGVSYEDPPSLLTLQSLQKSVVNKKCSILMNILNSSRYVLSYLNVVVISLEKFEYPWFPIIAKFGVIRNLSPEMGNLPYNPISLFLYRVLESSLSREIWSTLISSFIWLLREKPKRKHFGKKWEFYYFLWKKELALLILLNLNLINQYVWYHCCNI